MTSQILKQRSKTLDQLLAALAPDFDKLQPKVNAVFEQGRKEGLDDLVIGDLVRSKMNDHYSQSTIQRVLPKTAKHQEKVRDNFAVKMTANERPPLEIPTAKVEPVVGTQEEPITTESIRKIAENVLDLSPSPQSNNKTIEQPGPNEVQGRHNIAPEEYEIEHLQEYNNELLVDIVKYLDKRPMGQDALCNKIDVLKHENADLKEQLQLVKPFVELFSTIPSEERESWLQFMKNALRHEKGLRK